MLLLGPAHCTKAQLGLVPSPVRHTVTPGSVFHVRRVKTFTGSADAQTEAAKLLPRKHRGNAKGIYVLWIFLGYFLDISGKFWDLTCLRNS